MRAIRIHVSLKRSETSQVRRYLLVPELRPIPYEAISHLLLQIIA